MQFISTASDNRLQVDATYTDLAKAFVRVHHGILVRKLRCYGINIMLMIVGREHIVGFKSEVFCGKTGVAQGSNLGPITVYFLQ